MGKLADYLMHPVSQLVLMVSAFILIGFLLNVPSVEAELSVTTITPENGAQIAYASTPTVLPTPTDWPTATALPSATTLPTATLIPTSTPWPTDTPTLLPTDTLHPAPTDTATLIPGPPPSTLRVIVPEPPGAICPCHNGDVTSCRDFRSQEDAQACYAYCVGQGFGDVHGLDEGFNNRACIYLPAATAVFVVQPVVPTAAPVIVQPTTIVTPVLNLPNLTSTPIIVNNSGSGYLSGGLGLSKLDWEKNHTETELDYQPIGTGYDYKYDVMFQVGNVWAISRGWGSNDFASIDDVEAESQTLIPSDSQLVERIVPTGVLRQL